MPNFPLDKLPKEYNQDILTRQMEDIYSHLGKIDGITETVDNIREELDTVGEEVGGISNLMAQNRIVEHAVMPPPQNLTIRKMRFLPVVFVSCKHLEIIKYPYVAGFQFFISQQHDFTPISDSGEMTLTGTHSGVAGMTLSHTADLTNSTEAGLTTKYTNLPFWTEMGLVGSTVINVTDNSTGTITAWSHSVAPWQMTTTLVGGSTNQWNNGDTYNIKLTAMRSNLIHQGPLPMAIYVLWPDQIAPKNFFWDTVSFYVKARTYGIGGPRSGRFSDFVCASTTVSDDWDLSAPTIDTVNNIAHDYTNDIDWDGAMETQDAFSHYRVYRTIANNSNLLTNDTFLIADHVNDPHYEDKGYDAVTNPTGAVPCTTYYYWIRPVDVNGNIGDNSPSVSGHILIANDPVIYNGLEEEDKGYGNEKSWVVYWYTVNDAMGYFVRYRFKLNGTYGIWTEPVYIPHTTEFGQTLGEDIQSYTFQNLIAGRTYTFAVKATWNPMIPGLSSNWVTQDYTISNTSAPAAPT